MVDKKKVVKSNAEKPISLKPLKFDEAVSDLLKVKPETKTTKPDVEVNTNGQCNRSTDK